MSAAAPAPTRRRLARLAAFAGRHPVWSAAAILVTTITGLLGGVVWWAMHATPAIDPSLPDRVATALRPAADPADRGAVAGRGSGPDRAPRDEAAADRAWTDLRRTVRAAMVELESEAAGTPNHLPGWAARSTLPPTALLLPPDHWVSDAVRTAASERAARDRAAADRAAAAGEPIPPPPLPPDPSFEGLTADPVAARARLDARLARLEAMGTIERLAAAAEGPVPRPTAATLRDLGFGTVPPLELRFDWLPDTATIARLLHAALHRDAVAGDLRAVSRDLEALAALDRFLDGTPGVVGLIQQQRVRTATWRLAIRLAHDGHLTADLLDAMADNIPPDAVLHERVDRMLATEHAFARAMASGFFDARGRLIPAAMAVVRGDPPGDWTANLEGLAAPRRRVVLAEIDDVFARMRSGERWDGSSIWRRSNPPTVEEIVGLAVPAFGGRDRFDRSLLAEARLARIALRVAAAERRTGAAPVTLADLAFTDADLTDPYTGTPMRYARRDARPLDPTPRSIPGLDVAIAHDRRWEPMRWRVWSVGRNERDDRGCHAPPQLNAVVLDDIAMPAPASLPITESEATPGGAGDAGNPGASDESEDTEDAEDPRDPDGVTPR